ncbi:MAG TPA: phage holin family protein [Mycobacteriales bacterium]|jgi:hypothetical protein|nr:phage holin family protein [Mycobacteriales bacterium]
MAYLDVTDQATAARTTDPSLGELVGQATKELSTLVRKEIELAKAELSTEIGKAGKGAGMFGGAGVMAMYALTFLSLAAMFGLGAVMPLGWAALIVGAVYVVAAAMLALTGKKAFTSFSPKPERTIKTLKEDAQWARHPSS